MTKLQIFVVVSAILLFFALHFGFDTVPPKQKSIEEQRVLQQTSTDIANLLQDAKAVLKGATKAQLLTLEQQLQIAKSDSAKIAAYEQLSSAWYQQKKPAIAGYYAEQLALLSNTEAAWSITGTTYAICVQREEADKVKSFCSQNAVKAFENATSLAPENIQHRINLALVHTSNPPPDMPMKGIMMLLDLNKKHPDNVLILTNLARLGMQTGQYEKAAGRLERAMAINPTDKKIVCMLSDAYQQLGRKQEALAMAKRCQSK
ncbi:MAG: tetratricopeptide repeat protein [Bacteroidota bacterium]